MLRKTVSSIKKHLLAGIFVLIPLAITYMALRALYNILLGIFRPVMGMLLFEEEFPQGLEILITILIAGFFLYLVGLLSRMIVIKRLIGFGEKILARIPVVKFLYLTSKQVLDSIRLMKKRSLNKVVVVEYPRKGIKCLAFVTGEMRFNEGEERDIVNIFLPSTPNPTTGFFLMLPREQVWDVNITMEQATKMLISGGMLIPETFKLSPYQSISSSRIVPEKPQNIEKAEE